VDGERQDLPDRPRSQSPGRIGRVYVPSVKMCTNDMLFGAQHQDVDVRVRTSLAADEKIDRPTSGDPPSRLTP